MAVQADALEVLLRVVGVRTFQAQMYEARRSVAAFGNEAALADKKMAAADARAAKRAALIKRVGIGTAAALAVMTGEGVKLAVDFQKQITLVHTQAGASAADLGMIHDGVLALAHEFPQAPEALAKGMYHLQSVLQDSSLALGALKIAAKGASTGNADLEETTSALAAATRAVFGEVTPTLKGMDDIMGTLNATVGAGNMRMEDLVLALSTGVVPAGKTAGLALDDIGGALATLTDEGQRADNAATHLRMAFTLMGASSRIAQRNLAKIGINANQLGTVMHGPGGLVEALRLVRTNLEKKFPTFGTELENVKNLHDAEQLAKRFQIISKAFGGARSSATIMLLLNSLGFLEQKTKQVQDRQGQLNEMWEKTKKTSAARMRQAVTGLQADLILLGEQAMPAATSAVVFLIGVVDELVKNFTTVVKIIKSVNKEWHKLPGIVQTSGEVIVVFVGTLGIAAVSMWGMAALLGMLSGAWLAFAGAVDTARIALYIMVVDNPFLFAFAVLGTLLVMVITHWKELKRIWETMPMPLKILAAAIGSLATALTIFWGAEKVIVGGQVAYTAAMEAMAAANVTFGASVTALVAGPLAALLIALADIYMAKKLYDDTFGVNKADVAAAQRAGEATGPSDRARARARLKRIERATFGPKNGAGSSAPSLRHPRSHTPDPTPAGNNDIFGPIEVHSHVHLDGKQIYKSVEKQKADKRARG